jgi:hypothetical protein
MDPDHPLLLIPFQHTFNLASKHQIQFKVTIYSSSFFCRYDVDRPLWKTPAAAAQFNGGHHRSCHSNCSLSHHFTRLSAHQLRCGELIRSSGLLQTGRAGHRPLHPVLTSWLRILRFKRRPGKAPTFLFSSLNRLLQTLHNSF